MKTWSTVETKTREIIWNYEQSLIDWAHSGRPSETKRSSTKTSTNFDEFELIGVHVFFRHGARTPLHLLPNLDEVRRTKKLFDVLTFWIFVSGRLHEKTHRTLRTGAMENQIDRQNGKRNGRRRKNRRWTSGKNKIKSQKEKLFDLR